MAIYHQNRLAYWPQRGCRRVRHGRGDVCRRRSESKHVTGIELVVDDGIRCKSGAW